MIRLTLFGAVLLLAGCATELPPARPPPVHPDDGAAITPIAPGTAPRADGLALPPPLHIDDKPPSRRRPGAPRPATVRALTPDRIAPATLGSPIQY